MKQDNSFFMAHQSSSEPDDQIPSQPLVSKDHHVNMKQQHLQDKDATQDRSASKTLLSNKERTALQEVVSAAEAKGSDVVGEALGEDSGREKLKRHRIEVAGRVWIPEIWGQEDLLKEWIDCTAFDAPLVPSRISTARAALVEEDRRVNAAGLRIENRC